MKGGSFMANTEIFLRNIFGTTRPNIRPLVLALNITNDLLFEQHISMSDIKATKHIYPDVARLLHKKPETVYKSVIRLAHRCWDALVEQDGEKSSQVQHSIGKRQPRHFLGRRFILRTKSCTSAS